MAALDCLNLLQSDVTHVKLIANWWAYRNGALGMVELPYEAGTERAGIHDNPESGNHLL